MNISIAGFSVHGLLAEKRIDIYGYLESCKYRYRLDTADIWNGLIGTTDDTVLRKVRQALDERELTLVNYHVDGCHLWEEDPETRERNYRVALDHLRAAAFLGAKTFRVDTGGRAVVPMNNEQADYIVRRYAEYCRFGADHGMRVGPENHWGLSLSADNMEKIARGVDSPAYGILLHIGHWEDCPEDEGDQRLAPWTAHTHVDAKITRTKLADRMGMLLAAGYTGCWGVEHHSAKNEYEEIAYQLAEVQRVLAQRRQDIPVPPPPGQTLNPLLTPEQEAAT